MSLTRQVKQELSRSEETLSCCASWELKAFLIRHGYYTIRQKKHFLIIAVDDIAVARRLFKLLRQSGVEKATIIKKQDKRFDKNRFLVEVSGRESIDALLVYLDLKEAGRHISFFRRQSAMPRRSCCQKAFLRGFFLCGGSVSISRRSGYHLEVNCGSIEDAEIYQDILGCYQLNPGIRRKKGHTYIYFKNAEAVADLLRIVGAGNTLLALESMRVVKSMRNRVNRLVNFETANLEKIVASAQHQLDVINRVDRLVGLNNLAPGLREAAMIRRNYPEASMKELGELLDPVVSKSAMNHRFRQLENILSKTQAN